jgi:hypothetical protein
LSIEYCPTDEMIGDFFTKPLQGAKSQKFWWLVLNLLMDTPLCTGKAAQECVESCS